MNETLVGRNTMNLIRVLLLSTLLAPCLLLEWLDKALCFSTSRIRHLARRLI